MKRFKMNRNSTWTTSDTSSYSYHGHVNVLCILHDMSIWNGTQYALLWSKISYSYSNPKTKGIILFINIKTQNKSRTPKRHWLVAIINGRAQEMNKIQSLLQLAMDHPDPNWVIMVPYNFSIKTPLARKE